MSIYHDVFGVNGEIVTFFSGINSNLKPVLYISADYPAKIDKALVTKIKFDFVRNLAEVSYEKDGKPGNLSFIVDSPYINTVLDVKRFLDQL